MSERRALNNDSARSVHQVTYCRRSSSYASRVRPLYPARNPASAASYSGVNTGDVASTTTARVAGTSCMTTSGRIGRTAPARHRS
jgi:hypothetical protein